MSASSQSEAKEPAATPPGNTTSAPPAKDVKEQPAPPPGAKQLVSEPGRAPWETQLIDMAAKTMRFLPPDSESAEMEQLEKKGKIKAVLSWPPFAPRSEEELEDWIDAIRQDLALYNVGPKLFLEMLASGASQRTARVVRQIAPTFEMERMVDTLAKQLFPRSDYYAKLEVELIVRAPAPTALDAVEWIQEKVARYVRVRERRRYKSTITNQALIEILRRCLPKPLLTEVEKQGPAESFEELSERAHYMEPMCPSGSPAYVVAPVEQVETAMDEALDNIKLCSACGGVHRKKDCRYREYRCRSCGQKGHLARACMNTVIQEGGTRPQAVLTNKPHSMRLQLNKTTTPRPKWSP